MLVITGPTASGKTRRAVDVARALDAEIISGDSRQVYRGMDLGTGKDLDEYGDVPYHLIDIAPAGYKYNLYEFLRDYDAAEARVRAAGRMPLLCGGTGLYVESVLNGIHLPEVPA
ncbi:MAG: tRNA (adenosine(37)-N6)-dimethylallyltransferase MiaA, partial [Muribaculaceae bacterium]|nr:tRNA (adenosine(37)-N6)-dimethylallyltransferase MiaA [Muribaculaceae bacterium]